MESETLIAGVMSEVRVVTDPSSGEPAAYAVVGEVKILVTPTVYALAGNRLCDGEYISVAGTFSLPDDRSVLVVRDLAPIWTIHRDLMRLLDALAGVELPDSVKAAHQAALGSVGR